MLSVEQFRYGDNFSYLIYGKRQAMAIDGGAWQEILAFLKSNSLELAIVTNTHGHFDHTSGNDELLRSTKAQFLDFADYSDDREITIDGEKIFVWRTPGHTADSVCFYTGSMLLSPATLSSTAPSVIVLPVI